MEWPTVEKKPSDSDKGTNRFIDWPTTQSVNERIVCSQLKWLISNWNAKFISHDSDYQIFMVFMRHKWRRFQLQGQQPKMPSILSLRNFNRCFKWWSENLVLWTVRFDEKDENGFHSKWCSYLRHNSNLSESPYLVSFFFFFFSISCFRGE